MHVATITRKRGMSCVELDCGWEVFTVTRLVVKIVRKRGACCAELDWVWGVFTITRLVATMAGKKRHVLCCVRLGLGGIHYYKAGCNNGWKKKACLVLSETGIGGYSLLQSMLNNSHWLEKEACLVAS